MNPSALPRPRRRVPVAVLLVIALAVAVLVWRVRPAPPGPEVGTGPAGAAFYEASPEQLAAGRHGTLIWSRRVVVGPTIGGSTHCPVPPRRARRGSRWRSPGWSRSRPAHRPRAGGRSSAGATARRGWPMTAPRPAPSWTSRPASTRPRWTR
uniref:Uncharacterized protein n=1 Tax=Janibacter limosus TaxID=53458 RepID=A0AC61U0X8_9MICO|nr:hypothetical protein [Janibacter limosus]